MSLEHFPNVYSTSQMSLGHFPNVCPISQMSLEHFPNVYSTSWMSLEHFLNVYPTSWISLDHFLNVYPISWMSLQNPESLWSNFWMSMQHPESLFYLLNVYFSSHMCIFVFGVEWNYASHECLWRMSLLVHMSNLDWIYIPVHRSNVFRLWPFLCFRWWLWFDFELHV